MNAQDLRLEAGLEEMARLIARFAATDGSHRTAVPALDLYRASAPSTINHGVHQPCVCVIAQGAKRVMLNGEVYLYDRARYLAASVDLPVTGQITRASPAEPYLALKVGIDLNEVAAMLLEMSLPDVDAAPARGLYMSRLSPDLVDALVRLLRLLGTPEDISALAPLAIREFMYRLLRGEEGARLRHVVSANGRARRVARAIEWLRKHFTDPLSVAELAGQANMSVSSFHEHFKAVTAMSPRPTCGACAAPRRRPSPRALRPRGG